ncbi:hypothetical protein XENTR_v10001437 [Xenopus tropicalis]|nr:hypothetical protein XENTR_v10001437 [Xenopus tropicalis]
MKRTRSRTNTSSTRERHFAIDSYKLWFQNHRKRKLCFLNTRVEPINILVYEDDEEDPIEISALPSNCSNDYST